MVVGLQCMVGRLPLACIRHRWERFCDYDSCQGMGVWSERVFYVFMGCLWFCKWFSAFVLEFWWRREGAQAHSLRSRHPHKASQRK